MDDLNVGKEIAGALGLKIDYNNAAEEVLGV